ncbi:efflux RND transporter periplasmic adaptor subunit [Comamonas guangdongensis]|uniref:Efflux RND transporter periplasmic adaptor subunit n=1 Tax=Comamonas guangdongensis TaxID=510515 RepID=A0ABV3ZZB5_9BURK
MQDTLPPGGHPEKRRSRLWIIPLIVLIAIGIAIWMHLRHAQAPSHGPAPQVVGVATAARGDMPEILNALGTVTPEATVTVLPQLSGYLTEVGYREGEMVKKGQFLAQIDARQYEITRQQAEAQLAKDQAALAQAQADLQRYAQLNERKSIAPQTYADQQFLVKQQQAAIKADQAAIAQAQLNISLCRITAPVAGRVGLRLVDPGNYVTASSQPGIVVITSVKPTTVEFNVPQAALARVLQRFHSGEPLTVAAFSSDNGKQVASGTLYAIGNQMATSTGTVTLRARFANDDEALFPNDFVNVQLHVDTLRDRVLVPTAAIQSGAPGNFVFLVNADRSAVSVRKVAIGPADGKNTVISQGLSVGDTVVVDGVDRLSEGARVKLQNTSRPAGNAAAATPGMAAGAAR